MSQGRGTIRERAARDAAAFDALLERGIASLRSTALRGFSAPLNDAVPPVGLPARIDGDP